MTAVCPKTHCTHAGELFTAFRVEEAYRVASSRKVGVMALKIVENLTSALPKSWNPVQGGLLKYPIQNPLVLQELTRALPGEWKKVIRQGKTMDLLYFEHKSGRVAEIVPLGNGKDA